MSSILHFFVNSSVPRRVSYYESNFGPLEHAVRISGYSKNVLEEILSAVRSEAEKKGASIQIIHHCLDNSVQGIILPECSAGVFCDDVYDPEAFQPPEHMETGTIASIQENLATAREMVTKARRLHDEQEKIYVGHMDFDAADRLTKDTIHLLLDGKKRDRPGSEVHRFFGAATIAGNVDYIPEVTQEIPKRYFVKGRPGTGKSTFLKKIASAAKENGYDVEIYHCSLDPDSLDLVAVRELGVCLFDSTAPHEYFPSRPDDEIIDIYQKCVTPGTDEKYRDELDRLQNAYKGLISAAVSYLKKAKKQGDAFDSLFPSAEPEELEAMKAKVIQTLFQ